ncbi:acyltransferase [Flavobacterium sp.]|uniref:acyltransferase family protein n=1 Tax=Flavobacterium sp. TaxID=239 RepID=UPI0028BDE872|nr:acyltransferase [Flavobacterium sp.]
MEQNRIFGLDLMRAAAIIMVLCSHVLWIYPESKGFLVEIFKLFGFWGVEIFFVLSGFLIGRILYRLYLKEDFTTKTMFYFLKRRWFRTLPNYYLVLLLNIVIALIIGTSLKDVVFYPFFLQNFAWTMKPFFTESWSLSVEEFAYLFLPLAFLFCSFLVRPKNKSRAFFIIVFILTLLFLIFKLAYQLTTENIDINQWNLSLKAVVIYRIDSILIGVLAAWFSMVFVDIWKSKRFLFALIGLVFVGFMYVGVGFFRLLIDTHPFFWNVLYLPLTSITFSLFLPFLSEWKAESNWLTNSITFTSKISYSIYLLHYGVVLQLMKYFISTEAFSTSMLHGFTFAYLLITFLLSFLLYRYFEKPIMDLRDRY